MGVLGTEPGPLTEQQVLLTTKPTLSSLVCFLRNFSSVCQVLTFFQILSLLSPTRISCCEVALMPGVRQDTDVVMRCYTAGEDRLAFVTCPSLFSLLLSWPGNA